MKFFVMNYYFNELCLLNYFILKNNNGLVMKKILYRRLIYIYMGFINVIKKICNTCEI